MKKIKLNSLQIIDKEESLKTITAELNVEETTLKDQSNNYKNLNQFFIQVVLQVQVHALYKEGGIRSQR